MSISVNFTDAIIEQKQVSHVLWFQCFVYIILWFQHNTIRSVAFFHQGKKGQSLADSLVCARFNFANGCVVCRWQRQTQKINHINVMVRTLTRNSLKLPILTWHITFRWYTIAYRFKEHSFFRIRMAENLFSAPKKREYQVKRFGISFDWMGTAKINCSGLNFVSISVRAYECLAIKS